MTGPRRRWFQFSIRETALCLVALGFALCWFREWQLAMPIRMSAKHIGLPEGTQEHADFVTINRDIGGVPVTIMIRRQDSAAPQVDRP